jgi:hypothetical protein
MARTPPSLISGRQGTRRRTPREAEEEPPNYMDQLWGVFFGLIPGTTLFGLLL